MNRFVIIPSLLGVMLVAACSGDDASSSPSNSAEFPLTIELVGGGQLVLDAPSQRIASLSAHATEIFCAIGAVDQLVAVEAYANCPAGSDALPSLDSFQPNLEAIAGFEPDLVITVFNPSGLVESLQRIGIPVLYIDLPTTLEEVLEQIELLGQISGQDQGAAQLSVAMQVRIDAVAERLDGIAEGPRVFHELTNDYFTASPKSFIGSFYITLKATNIAAGAAVEYPQLSAEVIVDRNPQVIILADEAAGISVADVKARPGWDVIDAVKNDRICVVDPDIVSRPGPRIVDALEALAACLYPELFP